MELVEIEHEKQKPNGLSQGAIAGAAAEKQDAERGRGELREDLDILEAHLRLGTGTRVTRPYDSEDGARCSRVKQSTAAMPDARLQLAASGP